MASAAVALRGLPLPTQPAPRLNRGRDIISTILSTYGGDPGIQFTPVEEEWPEEEEKLLPPPPRRFDRGALYSPGSGSELGLASGDEMDDYDPYRQNSPLLAQRKKKRAEQLQASEQQQQQRKEMEKPVGKREVLSGEGKALPTVPKRVDSKFDKDLPLRPTSPLSANSRLSSPASSDGPAASLKQSISRSSKPASLKLQKSNGSTAASIRSASSVNTPPPPPPKAQRRTASKQSSQPEERPPPPPPKPSSHTRRSSVSSNYSVKRKPIKKTTEQSPERAPPVPSPTKPIAIREKSLPARPIEIDEVTAADLAVKHPAVAEEQALRATRSRRNRSRTASQHIDQILDQTSPTSQIKLLTSNQLAHSPDPESPSSISPHPASPAIEEEEEEEYDDMKKFVTKIKAKVASKDEDEEITDPAIQPGLGAEEPKRTFKVLTPSGWKLNKPEDFPTEPPPSMAYIEKEDEDQQSRHSRADSVFYSDESAANSVSGNSYHETPSQQRERTFSEATMTQPRYNQYGERSMGERSGQKAAAAPVVSLPTLDESHFGRFDINASNNESIATFAAESVTGRSPVEPAATNAPTEPHERFTAAVVALKRHQAQIKAQSSNAMPPVRGPVRPPYGPIAHLLAKRHPLQNQIKNYQLECKGDHKDWFGPRPNNLHRVPCQLCLVLHEEALWQCKNCAMCICAGCKEKVEKVMAKVIRRN